MIGVSTHSRTIVSFTLLPAGPLILDTASSKLVSGIILKSSIWLTTSHHLIPADSAGDPTIGVIIIITPSSGISTYAQIHSYSPSSPLKKPLLSTGGK